MSLETYWQKRNFARTKEPKGQQSRRKGHAFVSKNTTPGTCTTIFGSSWAGCS